MGNALLLTALLLLPWLGCGSSEPAPSPREVLERYLRASAAEDWGAVYELIAAESRQGKSPGEFASWRSAYSSPLVRALEARTRREVTSQQVEGDRAEIRLRVEMPDLLHRLVETGEEPGPEELESAPLRQFESHFSLVREGGSWKVIPVTPPMIDRRRLEEEMHRATQQLPGPAPQESGI